MDHASRFVFIPAAQTVRILILFYRAVPSGLTVEVASSSSITVTVSPPAVINGIRFFEIIASLNGTNTSNCTAPLTSSRSYCVLEGLTPEANYTISAYSCVLEESETIRSGGFAIHYLFKGTFKHP